MATLTVQDVVEAGLNPSFVAAAVGGDEFANSTDERTFLHAKNGSGGALTVTLTAQETTVAVAGFGTLDRESIAVSVPAAGERLIGPAVKAFNDVDGKVQVTYSGVTSLTVAAIKVPKQ